MAAREILGSTPAGHPRGSWPAEEMAERFRAQGVPATVVQDIRTDRYLVVVPDQGGELQ